MTDVVLITGSRTFTDVPYIGAVLQEVVRNHPGAVIRHGDCPTGVDAIAKRWCKANRVATDPMPADWSQGKGAGMGRNLRMVEKQPKPTECIAFVDDCDRVDCQQLKPHFSHGTHNCVKHARAHGIPVTFYRPRRSQ
jgi:YspA, cpYpsA-related SLOG family